MNKLTWILPGAIALSGCAGRVGPWEIGLILVIIVLLFGVKKLPELARSLGKGLREFRKAAAEFDTDDEKGAEAGEPPAKQSTSENDTKQS